MNIIYITLINVCICTASFSQSQPVISQYFQHMPAYAPALTGANDFIDLNFSVRQQWVGFEGAPKAVNLSGYGVLNGGSEDLKKGLKHGIGGFLQSNEEGMLKQLQLNINYAVHVPVFNQTYLSFGISGGLANDKVDIAEVSVKDGSSDPTYQGLLNGGASTSYLHLSGGLSLHSDRYYLAYSLMPMIRNYISTNESFENDEYIRHQFVVGGKLQLSPDVELLPNAFLRLNKGMSALLDLGMRFKYQQKYWAGLSYRNDDTLIGMLGLMINDQWRIGYAYEYGISGLQTYNSGTHELVLGLQLLNNGQNSIW